MSKVFFYICNVIDQNVKLKYELINLKHLI